MKYLYEAFLTPWGNGYEVSFPDLEIVTQGDDLHDAVYMAQDLLQLWISSERAQGHAIPPATMNNRLPREAKLFSSPSNAPTKFPK